LKRRLRCRAIALPVVLIGAAIACAAPAAAETAPGPRLAYQRFIGYPDVYFTIGPEGGEPQPLVDFATADLPKPAPSAGFTWSPDGARFAYAGLIGNGIGSKPRERRIYLAPTSGGPAVEVPGSRGAEMPIFAPDGGSLAVLRIRLHPRPGAGRRPVGQAEQSSIWLFSLDGTPPRRLTPWRHLYDEIPESFEPDGSALGIIRGVRLRSSGRPKKPKERSDAIALRLNGNGEEMIARKAAGLAFSPDGTKVALLRPGSTGEDLWVGAADGTGLRPISDGPRNEESPAWDPSSQRLAFVMGPAPTFHPNFGFYGNALLQVNADGTCQSVLRSEATSYAIFSPSWQPGPGRGAGPISC
jgi:Tol biopolymer transport system component